MRRELKRLPEFADLNYAIEDKSDKYLTVKYPSPLQKNITTGVCFVEN
jgi:hypothetical protein